ncbi:MAG: hypothetical protein EOO39_10060 [Cytophagaceae bacterium]|nr:MAG: hypothetical protein EOO39_10060 [Cytophagaceae bacterium]
MIYQLEIDNQDQTARAVLAFIQQIALTNKAIKPPVPLAQEPKPIMAQRPLGTMKGSFELTADFTEPLDDLADYM